MESTALPVAKTVTGGENEEIPTARMARITELPPGELREIITPPRRAFEAQNGQFRANTARNEAEEEEEDCRLCKICMEEDMGFVLGCCFFVLCFIAAFVLIFLDECSDCPTNSPTSEPTFPPNIPVTISPTT